MIKSNEKIRILSDMPMFQNIPAEKFDDILAKTGSFQKEYRRHEIIRHHYEDMRTIGIVLTGEIQAEILEDNTEQLIASFGSGDVFGEAIAFGTQKSTVEIHAVTDCVILYLPAGGILNGYGNPEIARIGMNLLVDMASKIKILNLKIRILKESRLRMKILIYLQQLPADPQGVKSIPFSQIQLAEFLGVNRSALSRELKKMKEDGIIAADKREIRILEEVQL